MNLEHNYLTDALAFSSGRRLVFLRLYRELGRELGLDPPSEARLLAGLESIHCSATIVDDMLDNEVTRRGRPTFYIRHSNGVAAFAALNLLVRGIELLTAEPLDQRKVLIHIRAMIDAEEADVGLSKRSIDVSPLEWYEETVSKKIAAELSLMSCLCLNGPIDEEIREAVARASILMGQFIQFCDDRLDVLIRSPLTLQPASDDCVLTYSLPLAFYMTTNGDSFESSIGSPVKRELADEILGSIRSSENVSNVDEFIKQKHRELISHLRGLNLQASLKFVQISEAAWTSAYWEDTHAVA